MLLKTGNQLGLSLIELVVVLAVIVVLTVVSVPVLISLTQNQRLQSTAESLYYTLQFARSEAIKQNTTVYVSFVTGDSWCYGVNPGSACNCAVAGNCSLLTTSAPQSQKTSLSATGYGSNYVYFESTHGAANTSGSLTFTVYNQARLITISIGMLGNLQMCSTGIGGYTAC